MRPIFVLCLVSSAMLPPGIVAYCAAISTDLGCSLGSQRVVALSLAFAVHIRRRGHSKPEYEISVFHVAVTQDADEDALLGKVVAESQFYFDMEGWSSKGASRPPLARYQHRRILHAVT